MTNDDVLICDPEDEYAPLVIRLGGQVVKISPTSNQYVNPMDINLNYSDDDNPLALKADFILSLCDIVVGSKDGCIFATAHQSRIGPVQHKSACTL